MRLLIEVFREALCQHSSPRAQVSMVACRLHTERRCTDLCKFSVLHNLVQLIFGLDPRQMEPVRFRILSTETARGREQDGRRHCAFVGVSECRC